MTIIQQIYEVESGEKATYRKNGADYHTLKYVRWLESHIRDDLLASHRADPADGEYRCPVCGVLEGERHKSICSVGNGVYRR